MSAVEERRQQLVTLVKTDGLLGGVEVGTQRETKCDADLPRGMAVHRAFAQLKRELPGENPMCWTVAGGRDGEADAGAG